MDNRIGGEQVKMYRVQIRLKAEAEKIVPVIFELAAKTPKEAEEKVKRAVAGFQEDVIEIKVLEDEGV